jgi:hypothetical protein
MKINIALIALFAVALLFVPATMAAEDEHGHEEFEENGMTMTIHMIETVLIIGMIAFAFLAANMFAQQLGIGMKILASGLALVGLNMFLEGMHHFNVHLLPIAAANDSHVHHIIGMLGFLLMTYGFYKIWTVAKGVKKK